jgi:hypothetical protein
LQGNVHELSVRRASPGGSGFASLRRLPAEASAIRACARQRNIRSLYHFTRAVNIRSILARGLLARDELLKAHIAAPVNDEQRMDGRTGRVSLSLGFPNHCLLNVYRRRFAAETWVVLRLDARVLWTLDCCFVPINASSTKIRERAHDQLRGVRAFESLFREKTPTGLRRTAAMRDDWPTDVQAEVMVQSRVPARWIEKVIFEVPSAAAAFRSIVPLRLLEYSRRWFGVRC